MTINFFQSPLLLSTFGSTEIPLLFFDEPLFTSVPLLVDNSGLTPTSPPEPGPLILDSSKLMSTSTPELASPVVDDFDLTTLSTLDPEPLATNPTITTDTQDNQPEEEPSLATATTSDTDSGLTDGVVLDTTNVNQDDSLTETSPKLTTTTVNSEQLVTQVSTDSEALDLTDPSIQTSGSLQDELGNTVLFSLTDVPGGTGNINAFLRLRQTGQSSDPQRGYNTDGTREFDTLKQTTQAIQLSDLPTVTVDDTTYYEFRIDLNESNSNPEIALSKLQVFEANDPTLSGYDSTTGQLAGLDPVINLDGIVQLDASLNSGSGEGDVLVYLPGTAFIGNPYLYIYSEFEGAESGFEEFSYGTTNALGSLADLSLSQTLSDTSFMVGDTVTFTVTLDNAGAGDATGVEVKDVLPSGLSFVSATPSSGSYDSATGIWNVGSVTSASNATLTLTATVLEAASAAEYTNVAEVIAADQFDPDSAVNNGDITEDDYTSVLTPVVDLDLSKQFTVVKKEFDVDKDGTTDIFASSPGDDVEFTITVTNNGVANATNVVINDNLSAVLPVGLTVQSLALDAGGTNLDTSGSGDGNAQTIEVLFDSIAAGESKTITVNAQVSDENVSTVNFTGRTGTSEPDTGELNTVIPEYYDRVMEGKLFFHLDVQKDANQQEVDFGFLDITSQAEIVSVNQTALTPGSITTEARLDVATYDITTTLNNGSLFQALGVNFAEFGNPDPDLVSLSLTPNPGGSGSGGGGNASQFIPNGSGIFGFLVDWVKSSDPEYLADLAAWEQLAADGDLSDTQDEQVVIDSLVEFINDGIFRRDRYSDGLFSLNNGTETQEISFEAGEFSPVASATVNVLVTDAGADVTDSNGNPLGSFVNLQAALDSFGFTEPTGVNVTVQDSSGDGLVATELQELSGFDFTNQWFIQDITIDGNVTEVSFLSGNGASNLDFSLQNIQVSNPAPSFVLQGDNAKDTIIGTIFDDTIEGLNGQDNLAGFDGNDTILGGLGNDTLIGGRDNDTLTGGSGIDTFVFEPSFVNESDIITDLANQDLIDLSQLSLINTDLDSNSDGVIDTNDNVANLVGGNLVVDLTSLSGGAIELTGVTSVDMTSVIL